MKAQWQLIDIETRETVATLGYPFDLDGEAWSWGAIEKAFDLQCSKNGHVLTLIGIANATKTQT